MRIRQLTGDFDSRTTADLMRIRDNELPERIFPPLRGDQQPKPIPLPDFLKNSNNRAARDSLYFIGECQRSRREFDASVSSFRNYVRKYPNGERNNSSLFLTALGLMTINRADVAVRTLDRISGDTEPTAAWFKHRWQGTPTTRTDAKDEPETPAADDRKQTEGPRKPVTAELTDSVDEQPVEPAPAQPKTSPKRQAKSGEQ